MVEGLPDDPAFAGHQGEVVFALVAQGAAARYGFAFAGAASGDMFNDYAIVPGVDYVVPEDIYLPGCPLRPEMLLDVILKLHDKTQNTKLGVERQRQVAELEEAGAPPRAAAAGHDRPRGKPESTVGSLCGGAVEEAAPRPGRCSTRR